MAPNPAPRLLLMGTAAVSATSKLMLTAQPMRVNSPFGMVDLVPGSVWQGNRVLIDCSDMVVHYMVGTQLYEMGTQMFLRDAWLNGLITASQAQWLVHVAKIEKEFLMGLFVPIAGIMALHCAQVVVVYANHREAFRVVLEQLPGIMGDLKILRKENPTLSRTVFDKTVGELISHIPEGIGAEDIAFWLGRILKGVGALPDIKATALAKVLAIVTTLVALAHAPGMAGKGTVHAIKHADVEAAMKKLQIHIDQATATTIARELGHAKGSPQALERLQVSLTKVLPFVQEIFAAWEKATG